MIFSPLKTGRLSRRSHLRALSYGLLITLSAQGLSVEARPTPNAPNTLSDNTLSDNTLSALNASAPLKALESRALKPNEARGYGGMVTADNALASEAGAQVLREGGDAVDAAVTTALMLGVLQPFASGIGGGGFAVVVRAQGSSHQGSSHYTLDFREVAPAKAHAKLYQDEQGNVIEGASTRGALAAGVPGEIAGLFELHKRHGKLPWARLVAPALKAAREGFEMHPLLHSKVKGAQKWLKAHPTLGPALLTAEGKPKAMGELVRLPKLAKTLERVAQEGARGFYEGEVARELARSVQAAGGIITEADLKTYKPKERAALTGHYGPYKLISMPPPSSGGAVILQVLKALEGKEVTPALHKPEQLHALAEALKHAFADRANLMGDPDFVPVPVEQMLSTKRVSEVRALLNPKATLPHAQYGGRYAATPDGGTSHFNVVDADGDAVALTTTINTTFGSRFVAGESGVLLNNEMDDFVAKAGVPNAYGLVGREANAISAGKRPLSSMSPTIILDGGQVRGMVGASGGPTIITGALEVALNLIHLHARSGGLGEAVSAPRVHHQWSPNVLFYDEGVPEETLKALRVLGHELKAWGRFTSVQALWRYDAADERGPLLVGASDPSKLGKPSAAR